VDAAKTVNPSAGTPPLDGTVASSPEATIHASRSPTLASARSPEASSRELPRISIALRGSLSGGGESAATGNMHDDRDIEVLSTLGEGGMGRVFLARQHSLHRDVAIKTVRDEASESERAALVSEGAITGHLEHPGIIPVHALGVDREGRPVLVMKRIEGVEWAALLDDDDHPFWRSRTGARRERLDEHLEILLQVCDAADFAHSRGIVHRDIKPQNVFIGRYREVYLGDWGLALHAAGEQPTSALCGTPAFMAPEMARGDRVDARTDVYLLGATLHRILTGEPRHIGANVRAAVASALESAPVDYPPDVPAELAAIANLATSRDPADRPASAGALRESIADYLRHKGSIALAQSARDRMATLRALTSEGAMLRSAARQHEIDLVIAEVRFALREALNEWSENPAAVRAARELEEILAARRGRVAELERLADELDPAVSRRQRTIASVAVAAIGVALSVSSFVFSQGEVSPREILGQSFAPLAIAVVMLGLFRRQLLQNLVNRRAVVVALTAIAGITVNRAFGLLAGTKTSDILAHDSLLVAALACASAALLFRWFVWPAVIMVASAVACEALPAEAMHAFSLASGASLLVAVWFVRRTER